MFWASCLRVGSLWVRLLGLRVDELWLLLRRLGVEYQVVDEGEAEEELYAYGQVFPGSGP